MEIDSIEEFEVDLEANFIKNDFDRIKQKTDRTDSLKFRLDVLNECLGGLLPGDFGIVGAYAEAGKTSFLVSEVTYIAENMEEGCVFWLNNEEPEDRIYRRIWESVLETDWDNILRWEEKAKKKFEAKFKGDLHRIRLYDIRTMPLYQVKKLVDKHKPKLIVIDLADKVIFGQSAETKDYQRLTSLYKELRKLGHGVCPVIALSHTDASVRWNDRSSETIKSIKYIDHSQLAGSKIGKAGEADFIIMMNKVDDYPNIRYINISKNKLDGTKDAVRHLKAEVYYDPEKHHFVN